MYSDCHLFHTFLSCLTVQRVDLWEDTLGQNGQKLNENYKINIFGAKQSGTWGQANSSGRGGISPSPSTRGNPATNKKS